MALDTHTHTFLLKAVLFALFCSKWYLVLFSSSPFPGQSEYWRKKGMPADRLPIFSVSFRHVLFSSRPTEEDSFWRWSRRQRERVVSPGEIHDLLVLLFNLSLSRPPLLPIEVFMISKSLLAKRYQKSRLETGRFLLNGGWRILQAFSRKWPWINSSTFLFPELKLYANQATSSLPPSLKAPANLIKEP